MKSVGLNFIIVNNYLNKYLILFSFIYMRPFFVAIMTRGPKV